MKDKLNLRFYNLNKRSKIIRLRNEFLSGWTGLKINKVIFEKGYKRESIFGDRIKFLDCFPLENIPYPLKKE